MGTPEPVPSTPIDIKSDGNSFLNPSESTFNVLNIDIPVASADQVDPLVLALDESLDEAMSSSSFESITQTLQERSQLDDVGGTCYAWSWVRSRHSLLIKGSRLKEDMFLVRSRGSYSRDFLGKGRGF